MKKMPCLFVRIFHDKRSFTITPEVTPGCEWVINGEGVASIKWDGTACMVCDGVLFKRYDAKKDRKTGEFRMPPLGAIPCDEPDETTGHWPHWVPVDPAKPEDKWHAKVLGRYYADGTYELVGPQINGNPYGFPAETPPILTSHGADHIPAPRSFDRLRGIMASLRHEGIVFAHPDGRMAKIRRNDFGLSWPVREAA